MRNAHLLRELQAVTDHHAATDTAGTWCWAGLVSRALLNLHKAAAAHPDTPVDPKIIAVEPSRSGTPSCPRHTPTARSDANTEHWPAASTPEKSTASNSPRPGDPVHQQPRRTSDPHDQDPAKRYRAPSAPRREPDASPTSAPTCKQARNTQYEP